MKVEIFVEVQATKPHPTGGEMYDPEGDNSWKLQDSIETDDKEILSGFLVGLAEEVNPTKQIHGRPVVTMHTNWKIVVTQSNSGRRGEEGGIIAQLVTKRNGVAGAMLRSTARSIFPELQVKTNNVRGFEND